jgi:hypothetical protein
VSERIWACKGDGEFEETTPFRLQEGNHREAMDLANFQRGSWTSCKICDGNKGTSK